MIALLIKSTEPMLSAQCISAAVTILSVSIIAPLLVLIWRGLPVILNIGKHYLSQLTGLLHNWLIDLVLRALVDLCLAGRPWWLNTDRLTRCVSNVSVVFETAVCGVIGILL